MCLCKPDNGYLYLDDSKYRFLRMSPFRDMLTALKGLMISKGECMNYFMRKMTLTVFFGIVGIFTQAMATDLVVVSWGGAYTASQQNAYHQPLSLIHI